MQALSFLLISWLERHQLPCVFKALTQFDCPGCGMQRSLVALLKGNLQQSFLLYPALIPILILFSLLAVKLISKREQYNKPLKYLFFFCASIVLVSYIYKIANI